MKDKDVLPKPVLAVHKYIKPQPPRHEPDEAEALDAYANAHALSRETLSFEVRRANGDSISWPYSSLRKIKYFGGGVIELRFDGDMVSAEGRNLQRLKDAINEHRQRFIQEGTDIERGAKPEDAMHIDRIVIKEAGAED